MGVSKTKTKKSQKPALKASDYVHLHNHTHYSLLDGLQKVPNLTKQVKKLGMEAAAITDHGTLSGVIEFYMSAKEDDIKPIIGIETYIAARKHTDKEPNQDKPNFHLILLAMNNQGYENLMKLSSLANLDGFYYKPRIDHDLLEKYQEGLIVLSGCMGGELSTAIRDGQLNEAKKLAKWYQKVFGDRYYIEIQDHSHSWEEQKEVNEALFKLAAELKIETVITSDAHYLKADDKEAHEVLLCVQTGAFLEDDNRMSLADFDLYLADPQDIIKRWGDEHPEAVKNTKVIADRCQVDLEFDQILIPKFSVPKGETEATYLRKETYNGLAKRYLKYSDSKANKVKEAELKKQLDKEVVDRAEYELKVINRMGFDGYFLIVSDFIKWGKAQGIVFGPGRGSAAGSIVSYAMEITDLNPLEYDLLFERFLNPDRISMPDIDIDIQDNRRDEVIDYVVEKYGQESVAHIVTFGTMAARNAIRDVSRVLQVPYADADHLAKLVPPPIQGRHIPLETSIKEVNELKDEYENNPVSKRVFDLAMKLEGTIRSHGVHAAGVVIAPDDIVNHTPLEISQKGVVTTQYSMGPIEDIGLLKMDFLGLSNLTIIKNTLRIIKKVNDEDIDLGNIALTDKKTYDLLGRGETTGVFQFESAGMKRYIKELKPDVFEDIVAMGALYRPGPLTAGLTDRFIDRKRGREEVAYEHPKMERALKNTYGVLVYQEQVMQIAQDLAGFTGGEADTLRKAIGKKKRDVMAKMKKQFVEGVQNHGGASQQFAEKFWKDLEGFADYAFNKSHSACYGLISYWTAYLKANCPNAFMSALMTSDYDDADRLAIEISECRNMGLEVLPPDVNESFVEFGVIPGTNQIRFGLAAVKNVGVGAVEEIIRAREDAGNFKSIEDFVSRVSTRVVNRKAWESLIKAGAFDQLSDRATLLFNLDKILAYGQKIQKDLLSGQTDLFGGKVVDDIRAQLSLDPASTQPSEQELLAWERELLGLYLSSHPLDAYAAILEAYKSIDQLVKHKNKDKVEIGGIISDIRTITTKKGDPMAFVKIADFNDEIELVVFPSVYELSKEFLDIDQVVAVKGTINSIDREGRSVEPKVLANELTVLNQTDKPKQPAAKASSKNDQRLYILLKDPDDNQGLVQLKQLLGKYPGSTEVVLVIGEEDKESLRLPFKIKSSDELIDGVSEIFSPECVVLK